MMHAGNPATHTYTETFDDGPGDRTQELAEYLKAEGIEGTFFINGNQVAGRQKHLQAILDDPHKPDEAGSQARRGAVLDWYRSTLLSRLNDPASGPIVLIHR